MKNYILGFCFLAGAFYLIWKQSEDQIERAKFKKTTDQLASDADKVVANMEKVTSFEEDDPRWNAIRNRTHNLAQCCQMLKKSSHKDNILKAKEIINLAEKTSKNLLEDSKLDIKLLVSRKLDMAKKQIESNEKKVFNSIRDEIIDSAFKLAEESINKKLDKNISNQITKESINEIGTKLL